jgi:AcrR family transcriptional regulator
MDVCVKRPKERIVDTAQDLFREHGIKGIGVDAIAEAAGTNKMTLYRHFGSKDELIAECMRDQARKAEEKWSEIICANPDPLMCLHAWVRLVAKKITAEHRGCDLANAAVEIPDPSHPARKVVDEFKRTQRNRLVELCRAAGAGAPEQLADSLWLLLEGARVSRQTVGPEGPSARFIEIAEAVIGSYTGAPSRPPHTKRSGPPTRTRG